MTLEDQHTDRKSLRTVTGKTADWGRAGKGLRVLRQRRERSLVDRLEDDEALPPAGQKLRDLLLPRLE